MSTYTTSIVAGSTEAIPHLRAYAAQLGVSIGRIEFTPEHEPPRLRGLCHHCQVGRWKHEKLHTAKPESPEVRLRRMFCSHCGAKTKVMVDAAEIPTRKPKVLTKESGDSNSAVPAE